MLGGYRAVDNAYLKGYPLGQIEITIYSKDAETLDGWVTKHSGPPSSREKTRYWSPVNYRVSVRAASRDGLLFDVVPVAGGPPIHCTAMFLGAAYVLIVSWWSDNATYGTTLQQYDLQMLADLQT
jgi:hypothetical protein